MLDESKLSKRVSLRSNWGPILAENCVLSAPVTHNKAKRANEIHFLDESAGRGFKTRPRLHPASIQQVSYSPIATEPCNDRSPVQAPLLASIPFNSTD